MLTIELLSRDHTTEILKFEKENREFFDSIIPPRHSDYYSFEKLDEIISELVYEQHEGKCYMYLIRNKDGQLVGRVNLFSVVRGIFQKAEIGYRIDKNHNGKGYATKAVEMVLDEAFTKHKLHRVEASTSPDNIGSKVVLVRNGFEYVGRSRKYIMVNDEWTDAIHFEKINEYE